MTDENNNNTPFDGDDFPNDAPMPTFPVLTFLSGRPGRDGIRATGGFFISADEGVNVKGSFKPYALVPENGESDSPVNGFISRDVTISVVRMRRGWFATDGKRTYRYSWSNFDLAKRVGNGKARGKVQILCSVSDIETPVILSLAGTHSADVFDRNGWLQSARRFIMDPIARSYGVNRQHNLYFKFPIQPTIDDKGKPIYHTVGSGDNTSKITRIRLAGVTDSKYYVDLRASFVNSRGLIAELQDLYRDTEDWANLWDSDASEDSAEIPF